MNHNTRKNHPETVWVIDPIISKYSKRYIWGTTQDSLRLFFQLCNMRVYVDGFIDDRLDGMTIYHKKIYSTQKVLTGDSLLFISDLNKIYPSEIVTCNNPMIINPRIDCTNIYIYGAGYIGRKLKALLDKRGIRIKGFIDSDSKKENEGISGVKVFGKDILKSLDQTASVIEAGKYYQEIDLIINELNQSVDTYYYIDTLMERDDKVWVVPDKSFDGVKFFDESFPDEKIYLCGKDDDLVKKYFDLFKLFDYRSIYIAKWAEECLAAEEEICCIEDILLEQKRVVVFCDTITLKDLKKLHNLGLERGKDYCDVRCNIWEKYSGIQMLDVNLGYTRRMHGCSCCEDTTSQGIFPGIAVFGNRLTSDYKIAVLGGSTSTSGYYWFKSWPEIFYELYCGNNIVVFNGAVEGYTSSQELIKLMRDIVHLQPDLVIVYDGNNDIARDGTHNIFEIPYMKTVMEYARGQINSGGESKKQDIFCGVPSSESVIDTWLKNIEYMHAICKINNIKFRSFMQPMLFSKPEATSNKEVIVRKKWNFCFSAYEGKVERQMKDFRKCAPEICKTHEYIYDLSHIFDGKDVYMDHCHVFENGNRIIAEEIFKMVKHDIDL